MHSANHIAEFVVLEASMLGRTLTPMQLIKIVYICHGWMLGVHGRPLVSDEAQAWDYGPVFPALYQRLKSFRSAPVEKLGEVDLSRFGDDEKSLLKAVVKHYSQYSGIDLSMMTHQAESPWEITRKQGGKNAFISNDLIEQYYSKMASD